MEFMNVENVPLSLYIRNCFETKQIKVVTDQWRVETDQLMKIVSNHLKELGVYSVTPSADKYMKNVIVEFLQHSPEIIKLVHEAERRERIIARTKKNMSD